VPHVLKPQRGREARREAGELIESAQPDAEARQFSPVQRRRRVLPPPAQAPGAAEHRALARRRQEALLKCELPVHEQSPAKKLEEEVAPMAFALAEATQSPPAEEQHPSPAR